MLLGVFGNVIGQNINGLSESYYSNNNEAMIDNLPHYLDNTIFNGNKKVIATENGIPPENLDSSYYDIVLSFEEQDRIFEQARNDYINKYGIDPLEIDNNPDGLDGSRADAFACPFSISLPGGVIISSDDFMYLINGGTIFVNNGMIIKLEMVNIMEQGNIQGGESNNNGGSLGQGLNMNSLTPVAMSNNILTLEKVVYYIKNGLAEIIPLDPDCGSDYSCSTGPPGVNGPHEIDGVMYLNVFFAIDEVHKVKDLEAAKDSALEGWKKFEEFGIDCLPAFHYTYWDASDVGNEVGEIFDDLVEDCSFAKLDDNYLVMGFVNYADHNGIANRTGFYSIVAENTFWMTFKDHLIVTHELSHNIGGMGDTWWPSEHDECYMMYFSLWLFDRLPFFFNEHWCNDCYSRINDAIWQNP